MLKRKNYNPNLGIKFQAYNSMREQLEHQNAVLMQERQNIQRRALSPQPIPSQYTIIEQSGLSEDLQGQEVQVNTPTQTNKRGGDKLQTIYTKIEEVIDLCNSGDKNNANQTYREIAEAQKQILGFLNDFNGSPSFNNPNSQPNSQTKIGSRKPSQIKQTNRETIRQKISEKGYNTMLGDQLISMIEQIQRKALTQIEGLRMDKISLMKKLNQQVKAHNLQKKKRASSDARSNTLTQQLKRTNQMAKQATAQIPTIYEEQQEQFPTPSHDHMQATQNPYAQTNQKLNQNQQSNQRITQLQQTQQTQSHYTPARALGNLNATQTQTINHQEQIRKGHQRFAEVNSEAEIQNQINRLKHQNMEMRNTITSHKSRVVAPMVKEQLKNQLRNLQAKARHYQQILVNSKPVRSNIGSNENVQMENLLLQSQNLASEGQRLMRVRSKPQFRINTVITEYETENQGGYYPNQFSDIRKPTKTSLDYEGQGQRYSRKDLGSGNQFSPGKYQKIINDMKRATNY